MPLPTSPFPSFNPTVLPPVTFDLLGANADSLTLDVTVPASTQYLLVCIGGINISTACTWNGGSMTQHYNGNQAGYNCSYYYKLNPDTGLHTVSLTKPETGNTVIAAYAITGAHATTPFGAVSMTFNVPKPMRVTPASAVGDVVIAGMSRFDGTGFGNPLWGPESGNGTLSHKTLYSATEAAWISYKAGAAGTTTMGYTGNDTLSTGQLSAFAIKAA